MKVAVLAGSVSDAEYIERAISCFEKLGVDVEARILSAHRTPDEVVEFAKNAEKNGFSAIVAIAGMAAHLGGVVAAYTTLPVVAVPVASGAFNGLDALLASVQMPKGVPVAVVTVGKAGAENAALLIARFLALFDPQVKERLLGYIDEMRKKALRSQADWKDRK